jgi:hypothetical protein
MPTFRSVKKTIRIVDRSRWDVVLFELGKKRIPRRKVVIGLRRWVSVTCGARGWLSAWYGRNMPKQYVGGLIGVWMRFKYGTSFPSQYIVALRNIGSAKVGRVNFTIRENGDAGAPTWKSAD